MFRRIVSGITLTLLLIGMLTWAFNIQPVKAGTIIVPDDYPTIQEAVDAADPGDTIFVHNGTYYEELVVYKPLTLIGEDAYTTVIDGDRARTVLSIDSNVTLSGFTIQNGGYGILLWDCGNNVDGNIVTQTCYGIYLAYADENIISRNIVTQNWYGIMFDMASGNTLRYNTMTDNSFNFEVFGTKLSNFIHDIDTSNTVNGKPIYYFINEHNLVVDTLSYPNTGYLAIVNSSNVIVRNLNLTKNGQGVLSAFSTNSTMINVTVSSCDVGIHLFGNSGNMVVNSTIMNNRHGILERAGRDTVKYNNITNNHNGIWLHYSSNNVIAENTLTNNDCGILVHSDNNTVNDNMITDNGDGIRLVDAHGNMIIANTMTNNDYAVSFSLSNERNIIYHNNFINNTQQVYIDYRFGNSLSICDNGYPSGGNYWSDYNGEDVKSGPYQNETGCDGVGDIPHVIDENNTDRYPFMKPYPWASHDLGIMKLATSKTVVGQGFDLRINVTIFNYGNHTENFNVTVLANSTILATFMNITLTSRNSTTIIFTWNTTGIAKGEYTLSARATPVPGETDTTDNTRVDGIVTVTIPGHDVAIKHIATSKTVVGQNHSLSIYITAKNYGNFTETFNITAYYNDTPIETKTVTNLPSGEDATVTFTWNTTGITKGNYTIKAKATPVTGETDTTDNAYTDGMVYVGVPGDVNGDGIVNMVDIYTELILRFMCKCGDACYSANSDINGDGIINMVDIYIAIIHFMETEP